MLTKVAIRSAPEKLQQLFYEIRKQHGQVLEAFNPERVIALLPPNAQLQSGALLGRAEPSPSEPGKQVASQGTQPLRGKAVEAGRNADGRIEVFFIGMDDLPYHKWQLRPNGGWSGANLLGPIMPSRTSQIVAGNNADGRLELFYIGAEDNVIYHNWQLRPNGYWICEYFLGPVKSATAKQLALGYNADGRMEVFYVGLDDVLYHNWQTAPNGRWKGEYPVGPNGPTKAKHVVSGQNIDGRIEIFHIGVDDVLYYNWQVAPNGKWNGAQPVGSDPVKAKEMCFGRNADGSCELFYVGLDGSLCRMSGSAAGENWNRQTIIGKAARLGATQFAQGQLELFYIGVDDAICRISKPGQSESRKEIRLLEAGESGKAKQLTVGHNADGRLEIFYVGLDDVLYHSAQLFPGGEWSAQEIF